MVRRFLLETSSHQLILAALSSTVTLLLAVAVVPDVGHGVAEEEVVLAGD